MCSFAAPPSPSPHLIVCTSVTRPVCPSTRQSVLRQVHPSTRQPPQSVYPPISQSHCLSIPRTVRPSSPSIRPMHSPSTLPSVLQTICQTVQHRPTVCTPSYHVRQAVLHRLTIHPPSTPICQTIRHHHTICMTHQSVRLHVHHQPTV